MLPINECRLKPILSIKLPVKDWSDLQGALAKIGTIFRDKGVFVERILFIEFWKQNKNHQQFVLIITVKYKIVSLIRQMVYFIRSGEKKEI